MNQNNFKTTEYLTPPPPPPPPTYSIFLPHLHRNFGCIAQIIGSFFTADEGGQWLGGGEGGEKEVRNGRVLKWGEANNFF